MSVADWLTRAPHDVARVAANRAPALQRTVNRLEAQSVRRFGRSPLSLLFSTPVLVLETVGRRSGQIRSTPLAYGLFDLGGQAGRQLVVVGGAAGQRRVPDWVANLRAEPRVTVTIDSIRRSVIGREVIGSDRSALWPQLVERWPRIEGYEAHAGRTVPVFVFTPPNPTASG